MAPHAHAQHGYGDTRGGDEFVAKYRFTRKDRDDFRNHPERRQSKDVNFRMAKRPKDMLPQNGRAAVSGQKEMSFELSVDEKHGEPGIQYRQRREDDESVNEVDPGKQWKTTHRHSRRAPAKNGRNNVNGKADRTGAESEDRDRPVIDALPARIGSFAQRRVGK